MTISTPSIRSNKGFTLIELSIVLVIIGLIVGGVLVGQDLIKAAEIRATVSQIEKYDDAANTFRLKYNGLPGDLLSPGTFFSGLTTFGVAPDGDGLIEANGHATNNTAGAFGGESIMFWGLLSRAGMISENTQTLTSYENVAVGTIGDGHMPLAKMGAGNRIHIGSASGVNYYALIAMDGTTDVTVATGAVDAQHGLTPTEAFQIDTKLDDGAPATGRVASIAEDAAISAAGGGSSAPDTSGVDDCYDSDSVAAYSTGVTGVKDAKECSIRIRASF